MSQHYFIRKFQEVERMEEKAKAIYILVCDDSQELGKLAELLHEDGFNCSRHMGCYPLGLPMGHKLSCNWIFVAMNTKTFAWGAPGIKQGTLLYEHGVTVEEFKQIWEIFKKYQDKDLMEF